VLSRLYASSDDSSTPKQTQATDRHRLCLYGVVKRGAGQGLTLTKALVMGPGATMKRPLSTSAPLSTSQGLPFVRRVVATATPPTPTVKKRAGGAAHAYAQHDESCKASENPKERQSITRSRTHGDAVSRLRRTRHSCEGEASIEERHLQGPSHARLLEKERATGGSGGKYCSARGLTSESSSQQPSELSVQQYCCGKPARQMPVASLGDTWECLRRRR